MRLSRVAGALAGTLALSVGLSGVAAADSTTGQTGHFKFVDSTTKPGAVCWYEPGGTNAYNLYRVVVRAPKVWWPDTSSSSNTQHGKVGWRVIIKSGSPGSFTTLKKSGIRYAIAYEDHPLYDNSDKAPFTSITQNFISDKFTDYMVSVKVFWYRADGSVMGTATHDVVYYDTNINGTATGPIQNSYCSGVVNFD
jgi:hypothetical protein